MDFLVELEILDHLEGMVHKDLLEKMEWMGTMEDLELLVILEFRLVLLMWYCVKCGNVSLRESLVIQDHLEHLELLDLKDQEEMLELLVYQALKE